MITLLAKLVPDKIPAGATIGTAVAAVINPLAFIVILGIVVDVPNIPVFALTVARVIIQPELVISLVNTGKIAQPRWPEVMLLALAAKA